MPEFTPDDVYVYPEEFMNSCSEREIKAVIFWLRENDYLDNITAEQSKTLKQQNFTEYLSAINENQNFLTKEEIETIEKIGERFKY